MQRVDLRNLGTEAEAERRRLASYKRLLMVCTGTGCVSAKAFSIRDELARELKARGLERDFLVISTGCNGFCAMGPIMVVQPEGIFYEKLKAKDLARIVDEHLTGGRPVESLMHKDLASGRATPRMKDIPFFAKQELIALRNKGIVDPESVDSYLARGGYEALAQALTKMTPAEVVAEVRRSGLRGRGGGGFPTGVKWESCIAAVVKTGKPPVIVCNGDEGDPGAFMDRSIVETDPHSVLEGMCLGAYAVGAKEGYVYIRKEYPLAMTRLEKAIAAARERGLLGKGILGTDFEFDIVVHRGAGAFVCGESTALMASMEGRPGEPRAKYVHNVEQGYKGRPTVLNNVETWANVPVIVDKGGAWFGAIGTGDVSRDPWGGSSGTKVFSLVGNINNTGLVEVPMGMTLREIIFDIGGGIPRGRAFKCVQTGGPSGGCLPASFLDEPVDFDTLTKAGSMMGSGGMIVMDDHTCMVDVAKYFIEFLKDESCGKCTPCREGLIGLYEILNRISQGAGSEPDLAELERISSVMAEGALCALGSTAPNPVLSTLRYFKDEYVCHVRDRRCPAGVCKALIRYDITEACTGCMVCAKKCPSDAITGVKKERHVIHHEKCIKCGICMDVCKFDAVRVE
ncbi:MAG: NADH-ubiquinone oxidoreductase-F iron-sulfur binding region domain-containing protein [Deltaproteobacteria bacterium]|nr:NADH-ubiquinone oxidoreductase-F iron-sulfur binding region domain-containing protein [Deltaproteobacteria bacterium]